VASPLAALRGRLRRVGWLNSAFHLCVELAYLAGASTESALREYEREYARVDPWDYGSPRQRRRHADALALLDAAQAGRDGDVLEIGCAEGAFTALLAPRCRSLLAVDFSPTAVERARLRLEQTSAVRVAQWHLGRDSAPGTFDLVVILDVLEHGFGPRALRTARQRLVELVRPGGYLLAGNARQSPLFESSRWGRALVRGGANINAFVAGHPALETVASCTGEFYVHTLLRRHAAV
jgi:SAM-dependent methyltransferase